MTLYFGCRLLESTRITMVRAAMSPTLCQCSLRATTMMPTIKLKNPAAGKSAGSNWPEIAIPRKKINLDNKAIALCPPAAAGSSTGPQDQDIIVRLKDLLGGRKGGEFSRRCRVVLRPLNYSAVASRARLIRFDVTGWVETQEGGPTLLPFLFASLSINEANASGENPFCLSSLNA